MPIQQILAMKSSWSKEINRYFGHIASNSVTFELYYKSRIFAQRLQYFTLKKWRHGW